MSDADALLARARDAHRRRDAKTAREAARDVLRHPAARPAARLAAAELCLLCAAAEEGLAALYRLVEDFPAEPAPRIALGHHLTVLGRAQAAVEVLAPFERGGPADAMACRARALQAAGAAQAGLETAQAILRASPDHPAARFIAAACLCDLGRPAEALAGLDALIRAQGPVPVLLSERARARMLDGDPDAAAADYEAALVAAPDFAPAADGLADLLWITGRADDAQALLDRLCLSRPEDPAPA